MADVFADTGYWIAVLVPSDGLHERAKEVSQGLGKRRIVTTEMVLVELLGLLAKTPTRQIAADAVDRMLRDPNVEVVPQTGRQFGDALMRYKSWTDKAWSLTDCASFLLMEQRNMKEALAQDQHFEQAGFVALLRERSAP
jgi:predicted nucleic acid-binding protein